MSDVRLDRGRWLIGLLLVAGFTVSCVAADAIVLLQSADHPLGHSIVTCLRFGDALNDPS